MQAKLSKTGSLGSLEKPNPPADVFAMTLEVASRLQVDLPIRQLRFHTNVRSTFLRGPISKTQSKPLGSSLLVTAMAISKMPGCPLVTPRA